MINFLQRTYRVTRYTLYKETDVNITDFCWSFIGAFSGIALVAIVNQVFLDQTDLLLMIGSFGASAVLIYGVPESPLSQPRNVIGGHVLSAIIGVTVYMIYYHTPWLASSLAVSLAIVAMQATKTVHPPGGATALIATLGSAKITSLGFLYVVFPVATGAVILLIVGYAVNRLSGYRKYPVKNFDR